MADLILVDNFDSFVFNLSDSFERLGHRVRVFRNTAAAEHLMALARELPEPVFVISPGPGRPEDAGCTLPLIRLAAGEVPLIGVCLGHQAMLEAAGAPLVRAPAPVHGKTSALSHDGQGPFAGMPQPLVVARYHSLCVMDPPPGFIVHARFDGMAMAVSNPEAMQYGLQFHPESVCTPHGDALLSAIIAGALERTQS